MRPLRHMLARTLLATATTAFFLTSPNAAAEVNGEHSPSQRTRHQLDALAGVSGVSRTDRLLSPLRYSGVAPAVELGWDVRGPRALNRTALNVARGGLRSGERWSFIRDGETMAAPPSPATIVELRYAHGRKLGGDRWTLHLGGTLASRIEAIDMVYGFAGTFTYLGAFSLAPWADYQLRLHRRHSLRIEGWLPLVNWVTRSPYALNDDAYIRNNRDHNALLSLVRFIGDGRPQGPNHFQAAHLRVGWQFDFARHWALVTQLRADMLHFTRPLPLMEWQFAGLTGIRGTL